MFAPDGEEHWHGATADDFMTHLSITEGAAHWGDHVTDAEYVDAGGAEVAAVTVPPASPAGAGRGKVPKVPSSE